MNYKKISNDYHIINIYKDYINFDIYDQNEVKEFIYSLYMTKLKKYNLKGILEFNIYIDANYGMIIEIKKRSNLLFEDIIDIKIKFNLNLSFLYEIDYFYILENNLNNQKIYYYKNKFYLEIINTLNKEEFIKLLDNTTIIYDNKINNIISKGIKLANINDL